MFASSNSTDFVKCVKAFLRISLSSCVCASYLLQPANICDIDERMPRHHGPDAANRAAERADDLRERRGLTQRDLLEAINQRLGPLEQRSETWLSEILNGRNDFR